MRFYKHVKLLVHKDNNFFHNALRKYGLDNFIEENTNKQVVLSGNMLLKYFSYINIYY